MLLLPMAIVISISLQAQSSDFSTLLQSIENNNRSLATFKAEIERQKLSFRSRNKLADLQAAAYYLPFGEHSSRDYSEFELSQRFEFPTVYSSRSRLMDQQKAKLATEYEKLRQKVLLKAKKLALELIYLEKKKQLMKSRLHQSKRVLDHVQTLYDKGQENVIVLNKARIMWLDQQFMIQEVEHQDEKLRADLRILNGGLEIEVDLSDYPEQINLSHDDSLLEEYMKLDPAVKLLEEERKVAEQELRLEKNMLLPDISAGYNYQGVAGNNYHGVYGGLSIPLWGGSNKVKLARARKVYYESLQTEQLQRMRNEFQQRMRNYQLLFEKYQAYEKAMQGINSDRLLQKAFELGELSFLELYQELSFYREALDRNLQIEMQLYQLKAELLKYQL